MRARVLGHAAVLLALGGCISRGAVAVGGSPPEFPVAPHSNTAGEEFWRLHARGLEARLPGTPRIADLVRLANVLRRAGEPDRAQAMERAARLRLAASGVSARLVPVEQTQIDDLLWVDGRIAVVRRVSALHERLALARVEVWSPADGHAPLWVEYLAEGTLGATGRASVYHWERDRVDEVDLLTGTRVVVGDCGVIDADRPDDAPTILCPIDNGVRLIGVDERTVPIDGVTVTTSLAYGIPGAGGCVPFTHEYPTSATTAAIAPDGRAVGLIASDGTVRLSSGPGAPTRMLTGPSAGALAIAFVPSAEQFRVAFADGAIVTWRTSDGTLEQRVPSACSADELRAFRASGAVGEDDECAMADRAVFDHDAGTVVSWGWRALRIRDAATGAPRHFEFSERLGDRAAAFDDNGVLVHGRSGELGSVETWSSDAGPHVVFTTPSDRTWRGPYFFADRLDIPLGRGTVARWDLRKRTARLVRGPGRPGFHVHVLPDVAVSDGEATLEFLDLDADRDRAPLARVVALPSGGWIATNDRGAVDGTADALDHLVLVVEGDGPTAVLAPHFAWPAFHVPGLLSAALEGRSAAPPGVRSASTTAR